MVPQLGDVTKPAASAGRIASKGHSLVLDDEDGDDAYHQHKASGNDIKLHNKRNTLSMMMNIMQLGDEAMCHDTEDAHVLGVLGLCGRMPTPAAYLRMHPRTRRRAHYVL